MNTNLFSSSNSRGKTAPAANTVNEAGGKAYARTPEAELAQLAATGCFGNTFYVTADDQLQRVLEVAQKCDDDFIARTAVYSRQRGNMKDMPAVLLAILAARQSTYLTKAWPLVIDSVKMLRNFVQVTRSGVTGRKSFGSRTRRLIREWFASHTPESLFKQSLGSNPSVGDIIKMVHPKPDTDTRAMTYAYLMGKEVTARGVLPQILQDYLAFRESPATQGIPPINFQFLSSLPLTKGQWTSVCLSSSWTTLRMNLNTFQRHGVFEDARVVKQVAARLVDAAEIRKSRTMPYQVFSAYKHVGAEMPAGIVQALAKASDLCLTNIPDLPDNLVIGVDVSGSMDSPITGSRGTVTSAMKCVDVAALFASALAAKCPTARVIPFDTSAHTFRMHGSVVDTANALSKFGGGGTNCSIPIKMAAESGKPVDAIIIFSDNESWYCNNPTSYRATGSQQAWQEVRAKNPNAKLVCIDLTPSTSTQVVDDGSVANVGGFSDAVFDFLAQFLSANGKDWVKVIRATSLEGKAPVVEVAQDSSEES